MPKSVFSFFAGVGLLDLGFEQEGYNIVFVNEFQEEFMEAYIYARRNQNIEPPLYGYSVGDINNLLKENNLRELREMIEQERDNENVIGFIGGPPCPDFSIGGKNRGRDGENGILAQTYVNLIIACQPDFFVFENVKGLIKTKKHREYFEELKNQLSYNGYLLDDKVLNSLCFGVPQDRERVILIGVRRDYHNVNNYVDDNGALIFPWMRYAGYAEATDIKGLRWNTQQPFKENGIRRFPRNIPQEYRELAVETWFRRNNVIQHPNGRDVFKVREGLAKMQNIAEGDVSRKSFKRLHRWRYSPTAAYGNNEVHLHPYKARRLSVAEAMAIQSLPAWFELPIDMSLSKKFKVIGNGVPVLMSSKIARALNDFIDEIIV